MSKNNIYVVMVAGVSEKDEGKAITFYVSSPSKAKAAHLVAKRCTSSRLASTDDLLNMRPEWVVDHETGEFIHRVTEAGADISPGGTD